MRSGSWTRSPENATWSDLLYEIYVRKEIGAGLEDLRNGKSKSHEEVKRIFGIEA